MAGPAHLLRQAAGLVQADLTDWGPVPEPIGEPVSHTRGRLLHRDADGANETGVWECTPGTWRCQVTRDEFCHFLTGACTYTADDGTRLEIEGGDAAFFPAGWRGVCAVRQTVRKTYMIR
ncbi:MAG TPA: cupin domain-containing protein [Kiloniellales bacterium]